MYKYYVYLLKTLVYYQKLGVTILRREFVNKNQTKLGMKTLKKKIA